MHPPGDDELHDWQTERDQARAKIFTFASQYLKWGETYKIPANYASSYLKCDICSRPRETATYISWRKVLYCTRHVNAYNRKRRKSFGWRGKAQQLQRRLREEQTAFRG